jgi:hypothetical protein
MFQTHLLTQEERALSPIHITRLQQSGISGATQWRVRACDPPEGTNRTKVSAATSVSLPDVRIGPDMSGAAANVGERGVSLSACVLQRWRHSTGSDCRCHGCLPKYCLCGSTVRTSYTGNPNTRCLCRSELLRTKGPRKLGPAVARNTHRQEQR